MGLVIVGASDRRVHPVGRLLSQDPKDVVKALHAAEKFRRQADRRLEAALQLTYAYAKIARESGKIRGAFCESDPANRLRHDEIGIRGSSYGGQQSSFDSGDWLPRLESPIEVSRKRPREIFHGREPSLKFVHGWGKQRRGSVWITSNPQHFRPAIGPQQQRSFNLAGEKATGLAAPLSSLKSFKRLAPVED
jgi:hypothetical protein